MTTLAQQDLAATQQIHPWDPAVIGDQHVVAFLQESFSMHVQTNPAYRQALIDLTAAVTEAQGLACA